MNTLIIDTSDNREIIIKVKTDSGEFEGKSIANKDKAQATLPLIEKVLSDAGITFSKIEEIKVKKGPGSFTGLRVGISIANALSFALGVKVNDKNRGEIETPEY